MDAVSFLRGVPVLAGLSDELLERLSGQVRQARFSAGDWVMRKGDPATSMFIIRSGRVEVVDEGPPEMLIRTLRRGDVLGELALLRSGERSASVRARRDTELLELERDDFEALILEAPTFALGLTRVMGAQLAASRTPVATAIPPRTIAVVGLDGPGVAAAREVADVLGAELERFGTLATLTEGTLETIEQAEQDADRVLLAARSDAAPQWLEVCLRESDQVVALTTGLPDGDWSRAGGTLALRGCELIVLQAGVPTGPLSELAPRELQVIVEPERRPAALRATARRLAGRSPGLVFSGGGARAFAHLGALEELAAAGIAFDRVAGVSLGALVAGAMAMGLDPEALFDLFRQGFVDTNPTNDFAPPAYSLVRGGKTRRLLAGAFGERRIEELALRFFCQSCDLVAREAVVHRTGPVAEAIYASLAIPGVFPPVATADGRLLVDGGVLDNLPVATMARTGEGPVIALDVTGRGGQVAGAGRPRLARAGRPIRRALTGSEAVIPRLGETIIRTVLVGSSDTSAAARTHADLTIAPQVEGVGLMDWNAISEVRELGRHAARQALADNPGLPSRLMG